MKNLLQAKKGDEILMNTHFHFHYEDRIEI